ncbi:hypothetical protein SAICODRAFT_9023 [Saitoella complicata NRRL Y-17804]|uniref:Uncharacterized protein n=1 Tax=Saitoella complicata (strain BCRC 22490 / CBS 7301 / JCM 7358 / NBRC 10748 / NRRL Y-17804) TaxID=698492 RepID=A0A0E9NEI1_SAICN|nr:uncharacterized protein SAICODRAFT_9023 [Saitoella complicata NRRL Y-17804]ODQ51370.1 hypothetical protein SAICODRAFT_9023 [Saitoella complicata NRRL Y-17804]GAO48262.1 hypothetical protein G7K_2442-t1 [Saitoella complicata NRRL Y-17804]
MHRSSTSGQPGHPSLRLSTAGPTSIKPRQFAHLQSQLAQLQAHLSDLENHVRVTAIQAEAIRRLGGLQGGLFMAASRVLGEESAREPTEDPL